jgi:hypothetical protein
LRHRVFQRLSFAERRLFHRPERAQLQQTKRL